MTLRMFVTLVLFVLSEALGVACGEWFFHLHLSAIPPVGQSAFNANASHIAHLLYGAGVGLVLFLWSQLGMLVASAFHLTDPRRKAEAGATPKPGA